MKTTTQTPTRPAMQGGHTPGPWSYWPGVAYTQGVVTQDATATHIAVPAYLGEVTAANARLIAAAPDLLALVKRAVEDRIDNEWLDEARSAIAKTKGGAQ